MLCLAKLICQYAGTTPKPNEMRECLKIHILTEGQSSMQLTRFCSNGGCYQGVPLDFADKNSCIVILNKVIVKSQDRNFVKNKIEYIFCFKIIRSCLYFLTSSSVRK